MIVEYILTDIKTALFFYGKLGFSVAAIITGLSIVISYVSDEISLRELLRRDGKHFLIRASVAFYTVIAITIISREPGSRGRVDLLPFATFSSMVYGQVFPIENILLFYHWAYSFHG